MASRPPKNQNSLNLFLNNYFNALLAAALVIFLIIAAFVLIIPKFQEIQAEVQAKIDEEQNFYASSQRKLASLQAIGRIYSKISPADLQRFNSVLPDPYAREKLFGELEETVGAGGWRLDDISINSQEASAGSATGTLAEINDPRLQPVSFSLAISAIDYAGLKSLLKLLENNLRLLDITSVDFSPQNMTVGLKVITYYYQTAK
jgi:hypothetical protein